MTKTIEEQIRERAWRKAERAGYPSGRTRWGHENAEASADAKMRQ